jgi:Ser/Thr protein kinase RdoA (MazF antagonist)
VRRTDETVQIPGSSTRDVPPAKPERAGSDAVLATVRPADLAQSTAEDAVAAVPIMDGRPRRSSPRDPAEALTRSLAQLGDLDYMRSVLQDACDQFAPCAFQVEGFEVEHCKVTPWRDVSLTLCVSLRSAHTGVRSRQIISGTIFADIDAARGQFEQERLAADQMGTRPATDGEEPALAVTAMVPEMAMVLRRFPFDPVLTGLAHATDMATMTALLATHLPECRDQGWSIGGLEYEPMQYKPGRLCTVRYTLTLVHPRHADPKRIDLFGKVYRDDRWRRSYALIHDTWQASLKSSGIWCAAQPIAAVASWRLIVQSAVPGRQFRYVLADLTKDGAQPDDIRQASGHLESVARAVRSMQQSGIHLGPCLDFTALAAFQRDNLNHLRRVQGDLADEVHRLRAEIERLASACPASELKLAHGDFAHGNVMLDGERVGIIDFDRAGQAEPVYDIAYFLTHLASFGLRHPERASHLRMLCDRFREAYFELAPEVSSRRLALYEALDLSAYVLRNFRKRSHQAEWIGWAKGQIDSAWERLDHAASDGRTV